METNSNQERFLRHVLITLGKEHDPSAWLPTTIFAKQWKKVKGSIGMKDLLGSHSSLETKVEGSQLYVRQRRGSFDLPSANKNAVLFVDSKTTCKVASHFLSKASLLAVDLEGRLMKGGKIWLIQVATEDNRVYIFDLLTQGEHREAIVGLLTTVLESEEITKVMHDCRCDNEALRFLLNIDLKNVVDTQVFHEHIQHHKMMMGAKAPPKRIGLNDLLETYGLPVNAMKDRMHKMFNHGSESNVLQMWTARPLAPDVLEYAADDVRQLCACYLAMKTVAMRDLDDNVLLLSAAQSRMFIEPLKQDEPKRICFDAEGMPVYCSVTTATPMSSSSTAADLMLIDNSGAEIDELLAILPEQLREAIAMTLLKINKSLVEIVVDHGRKPSLLFSDESTEELEVESLTLVKTCLTSFAGNKLSNDNMPRKMFTDDNRMGLSGTLHRISGILDRRYEYVGLTIRIGRHVAGASELIRDVMFRAGYHHEGCLLVGCPGSGKTTMLRDLIGSLSGLGKRVIVVDTSNEIAGDGDVPHPCIGRARRIQVKHRTKQHDVLVEAVQNHNPEVIVIDEIGTVKEVKAAKTISQRGVALIATAHGSSLDSITKNPDLNGLIGGLQATTLGDMEMKKRSNGKKTIVERVGAPIFGVVVEVLDKQKVRIYHDVAKTIDAMLANQPYLVEERWREGSDMFSRRFYENAGSHGYQAHWYQALVDQVIQENRFREASMNPTCSSSSSL